MMNAEETLRQLGGRKFIAMTGANSFVKDKNSIAFKVPKAMNGINFVKITLNEMDTYDMEFGSIRAGKRKTIKIVEGIYNDQLQEIFIENTGLYTHL